MKLVFMGTPEFAASSLRALVKQQKHEILAGPSAMALFGFAALPSKNVHSPGHM